MAEERNMRPGYTVVYPNRYKTSSKITKTVVVVLLVISGVLMAAITLGAWKKLEGLRPFGVLWIFIYFAIAFYLRQWKRGLLPMAAAFAIMLLVVSLLAGTGLSGTSWFDRSHAGYGPIDTIFGAHGLSPDAVGLIVLLIAPIQALLIFFSLQGFSQGWNVEEEVPEEKAEEIQKGEAHPDEAHEAPSGE